MLSREENELLTRTGPGTPLGEVMRRYWIPALLSGELAEPDGAPVRLELLGEKLVAFRDTHGRIGVLEEFCPHRGVSLWLGRNEKDGLRCVYHGWKYDVKGNCVDQMNEPQDFKDKVHMKAYPTVEFGGVIWTYMGPRELQPPPPKFAWTQVAESHRHITKVIQECNWAAGPGRRNRSIPRGDSAPILEHPHRSQGNQSNRPRCERQRVRSRHIGNTLVQGHR